MACGAITWDARGHWRTTPGVSTLIIQHRRRRPSGQNLAGLATGRWSDSRCSSRPTARATGKEAGLGNSGGTADITCSASATVVYQCWNNGGKHPKAGNKETVHADVSGSGTFPIRNGQTTGSLSVAPPGPGSFACPSGQTLFLQSVEYDNVTISGEGASVSVGDVGPVTLHVAV